MLLGTIWLIGGVEELRETGKQRELCRLLTKSWNGGGSCPQSELVIWGLAVSDIEWGSIVAEVSKSGRRTERLASREDARP